MLSLRNCKIQNIQDIKIHNFLLWEWIIQIEQIILFSTINFETEVKISSWMYIKLNKL